MTPDEVHLFLLKIFLYILIFFGTGLIAYGIRFWKVKRLLENTPLSKVDSAALGLVRVQGLTKPRDQMLKAPVSGEPCCWWSCTVIETIGREIQVLGEITSVGFCYLQDDSGRVLIDPEGAIRTGAATETRDWNRIKPLLSAWNMTPRSSTLYPVQITVYEWRISADTPLFALGELQQYLVHLEERQQRLVQHMHEIKSDPAQIARADTNRDGMIDPQEWDAFRTGEEARFLADEAQRSGNDRVILRAPRGGKYVLSTDPVDQQEDRLTLDSKASLLFGVAIVVAVTACVQTLPLSWLFTSLAILGGLAAGLRLDL